MDVILFFKKEGNKMTDFFFFSRWYMIDYIYRITSRPLLYYYCKGGVPKENFWWEMMLLCIIATNPIPRVVYISGLKKEMIISDICLRERYKNSFVVAYSQSRVHCFYPDRKKKKKSRQRNPRDSDERERSSSAPPYSIDSHLFLSFRLTSQKTHQHV